MVELDDFISVSDTKTVIYRWKMGENFMAPTENRTRDYQVQKHDAKNVRDHWARPSWELRSEPVCKKNYLLSIQIKNQMADVGLKKITVCYFKIKSVSYTHLTLPTIYSV